MEKNVNISGPPSIPLLVELKEANTNRNVTCDIFPLLQIPLESLYVFKI